MSDKEKEDADKTAAEADAQKKKEDEAKALADEEAKKVDYEKELQEEIEKFEKKEKNREGYEKRKEHEEKEKTPDIQAQVQAQVDAAIAKAIPAIQSALSQDTIDTLLTEFSGGDEAKKKLLRFNFENKVSGVGTLRERMENAALITDKKTIQKTQAEMATALKNRAGLGASGLGSSTEGQAVKDNILTESQLADLKAKGWDQKKIDRFKQNLVR